MQAILTRYIPATDRKPSRIKAYCASGSLTQSLDYDLDGADRFRKVAKALRDKLGWKGHLICGCMPDSHRDAYVFVFSDER